MHLRQILAKSLRGGQKDLPKVYRWSHVLTHFKTFLNVHDVKNSNFI